MSERRRRQQLSQLELLNRITRAIEERQDLLSILQVVIGSLEQDLPIDFGCVCLYERAEQVLAVARVGTRSAELAQQMLLTFVAAHQRGEPFSVVLSDLGMPYVDGRKVAVAIKAVSPNTPVVLVTGWGQRMQVENDLPSHVDRVLSKPPKLAELREALANLTSTRALVN